MSNCVGCVKLKKPQSKIVASASDMLIKLVFMLYLLEKHQSTKVATKFLISRIMSTRILKV